MELKSASGSIDTAIFAIQKFFNNSAEDKMLLFEKAQNLYNKAAKA
jgi:hypothetical protein